MGSSGFAMSFKVGPQNQPLACFEDSAQMQAGQCFQWLSIGYAYLISWRVVYFSSSVGARPICHSRVTPPLSAWNPPLPRTLGRKIPSECDVSDRYAYCLFSTAPNDLFTTQLAVAKCGIVDSAVVNPTVLSIYRSGLLPVTLASGSPFRSRTLRYSLRAHSSACRNGSSNSLCR